MLVGSITGFIEQHGQWALVLMFVLLALESFGRPAVALHYRPTRGYAERYLPRAERFLAKHGGKAVAFGRFVAVVRT